jgi:beta-glucanase (GH16 family)
MNEPGPNYSLIWSEEFDSANGLDPSKWNFEVGYVRNKEKQYYTENRFKNCRIQDQKLILEAHKEAYRGYNYTSASICTKNKKEFLYGRIEVRAKLPLGRGIWPAIWTLGSHIDQTEWPLCGEIDIMEFVGYDPGIIHGNIHTQAYNHTLETNKGASLKVQGLSDNFHVFAIDWTEDKIEFFLDNHSYFSFYNDHENNPATWPFHKPHYLLINLAVGGFWGAKKGIDENIFPQQFIIDYVRYYKIR